MIGVGTTIGVIQGTVAGVLVGTVVSLLGASALLAAFVGVTILVGASVLGYVADLFLYDGF